MSFFFSQDSENIDSTKFVIFLKSDTFVACENLKNVTCIDENKKKREEHSVFKILKQSINSFCIDPKRNERNIDEDYLETSILKSDVLVIAVEKNIPIAFLTGYKNTDVIRAQNTNAKVLHVDVLCKKNKKMTRQTINSSNVTKKIFEILMPFCIQNECAWIELRAISEGLEKFYSTNFGFKPVEYKQDKVYENEQKKATDEEFNEEVFFLIYGKLLIKPLFL